MAGNAYAIILSTLLRIYYMKAPEEPKMPKPTIKTKYIIQMITLEIAPHIA